MQYWLVNDIYVNAAGLNRIIVEPEPFRLKVLIKVTCLWRSW